MKTTSAAVRLRNSLLAHESYEIRELIPGHMQRGGRPDAYDRVLASRVGAYGAKLIIEGKYGCMVGLVGGRVTGVPLGEVAGKTKSVPKDSEIIAEAKALSISFGD